MKLRFHHEKVPKRTKWSLLSFFQLEKQEAR